MALLSGFQEQRMLRELRFPGGEACSLSGSQGARRRSVQHSELLMTMAEVSIAFAGFSGVVGVFGYRNVQSDYRVKFFRVGAMVGFSLIAALFSFVPLLLSAIGIPEPAVWRLASGTLALALLCWTMVGVRGTRQLQRLGSELPPLMSWSRGGFVMIGILLVLLTNTSGIFGEFTSGTYLVGAFSPLVFAGIYFSSLMFSLGSDS